MNLGGLTFRSGVSSQRFKDFSWHLAQMTREPTDPVEGFVDEDVRRVSDSVSGNTLDKHRILMTVRI